MKKDTLPLSVIQTKSAARSGISITVLQRCRESSRFLLLCYVTVMYCPDPYGALKKC